MAFIEIENILSATNGGLDVILFYFPAAVDCINKPSKKFKYRVEEKTPSASLKCFEGIWKVTDFGGDGKAKGAVEIAMEMEGLDFKNALQFLATKYGVGNTSTPVITARPTIEKKEAPQDTPEGSWSLVLLPEIPEAHLKEIFSERVYMKANKAGHKVQFRSWDDLRKICSRYFLHAIGSYTWKKENNLVTISATAEFPLFAYIHGSYEKEGWAKVYSPKAADPAHRFRYLGKKPVDVLNGFNQAAAAFEELQPSMDPDEEQSESEKKKSRKKLDEIILCSGETDALNIAALGFWPVWMNSESQALTERQYNSLKGFTEKLYILFDLDKTGKAKAHQLNMQFLDFRTIELPAWLLQHRDRRGKPCKDVRDFIKLYDSWDVERAFKNLVSRSDPYQFWTSYYNGKSNKIEYAINNASLYRFLQKNGFWKLQSNKSKEGFIFIRIQGNLVKEVSGTDMKIFIKNFLYERSMDVELRNTFLRTNQLSDSSLNNLDTIEIDFTSHEPEAQYFFFINETWKVTPAGIETYKPGQVEKYIWEDEVINRKVKVLDPAFNVRKEADRYRIDVLNDDCLFLKFLQKTSKIYWRIEEEGIPMYNDEGQKVDGIRTELTAEEISIQEHHLVNKLYSLGYLLHRYKNKARSWAPWGMDNKIADENESHGGSGKSICFEAPIHFMKSETINGRVEDIHNDKHIFGFVTEHTDYVLVNDCNAYLNFDFFFEPITGTMHCNPKHTMGFKIPYADSPKIAFTSNYGIRKVDPSKERRIIYSVFSDYYHHGPTEEYKTHRDPLTDLGKKLFDDFTESEWNLFYNTMARATQLYLFNQEKITPPMENVVKRNMKITMGDEFLSWADLHFSADGGHRDTFILRSEIFEEYASKVNIKGYTMQRFSKQLKCWCEYHNFIFNPKELQSENGRIQRRVNGNPPADMIYIQTRTDNTPPDPDKLPFT